MRLVILVFQFLLGSRRHYMYVLCSVDIMASIPLGRLETLRHDYPR